MTTVNEKLHDEMTYNVMMYLESVSPDLSAHEANGAFARWMLHNYPGASILIAPFAPGNPGEYATLVSHPEAGDVAVVMTIDGLHCAPIATETRVYGPGQMATVI